MLCPLQVQPSFLYDTDKKVTDIPLHELYFYLHDLENGVLATEYGVEV